MSELPDDRVNWEALDPLVLSGAKLEFLTKVLDTTGVGLPEALELLLRRYNALRRSRPDAFCCGHEEYWKGFYS